MAERLVKIAKELNVGVATIVEFLATKGHTVENKPTSMISDEMHSILLKEFRSSMAEKEKADQIVIGTRPAHHAEEKVVPKPLFNLPKLADLDKPVVTPPVSTVEAIPVIPPVEPVKEELFSSKSELPKLKVLGKIDLDKPKPAPKPEPIPVPEVPEVVEEVKKESTP